MICDSHNDFLTKLKLPAERKRYVSSLDKENIICCAIYTTDMKKPFVKIKEYSHFLNNCQNNDLLLTIEDCWFINEINISNLLEYKPFSCGLVWNTDNSLCGGANGSSGITPLGKRIIKEMEGKGTLIDTAHMNHKSIEDFYEISTKPLFNSHSNIYNLFPHNRNLLDKHLKQIYLTDGFLGINFVDYFLADQATVFDIAKHIDYFVQRFSIKNIGIGSDFYGSEHLVIKEYAEIEKVFTILKKMGYSEQDIEDIKYNNFKNFVSRIKN